MKIKDLKRLSGEPVPVRWLQMECLVIVGLIQVFTMLFGRFTGTRIGIFMAMFMNLAAALFMGMAVTRPMNRTARKLMLFGLLFCLWILLLQIYDFRIFLRVEGYRPRFDAYAFFCEYMMLLPMASVLDEKNRDTGLKVFTGFYLTATAALLLLAGVLCVGKVSEAWAPMMQWQGSRLALMWHPNTLAAMLLGGMGLFLMTGFLVRKPFVRILFLILTVLAFGAIIMTNCRTVVIFACCLLGGTVFFLLYDKNPKLVIVWLLVAVVLIGVLFLGAEKFNEMHIESLSEDLSVTKEELLTGNRQGTFSKNLGSLNGRTVLWKGVINAMLHYPRTLLTGAENGVEGLTNGFTPVPLVHTHNSWMESLAVTGVIGLLFSLVLTWIVIKNCWILFFRKESAMYQKTAGLLLIAALCSQTMEVYLLCVPYPNNSLQTAFMLLTGYVVYWTHTLPDRVKKVSPEAPAEEK